MTAAEPHQRDVPEPLSGDVLVRVRDALPTLQPAERRVAQQVLRDPGASAQRSITALAELAATSESTVMRFCRAVGVTGYPALRLALASAEARASALGRGADDRDDLDLSDSLAQVVDKIFTLETRALEDTRSQLDLGALLAAVEAVSAARRIDVVGIGASGLVARDLQSKLHRVGLVAYAWTDVHAALTSAALLDQRDVVVGISHSGETVDTVEAVSAAAARRATTVALTNHSGSPLARVCGVVLTTAARETPFRSGATASRIAQLAIVDALFVGVAQRHFDAASLALTDTFSAVQPHRRP